MQGPRSRNAIGLALLLSAMGGAGCSEVCAGRYATVAGDAPVKLVQAYDLHAVAEAMQQRSEYTVAELKSFVRIGRTFDHIPYYVDLRFYPNDPATYLSIEVSENCSTSNMTITHRVRAMIDDMPLTPAQKAELKTHVSTRSMTKSIWSL